MSTPETSNPIFTNLQMLIGTHDFGSQLFDLLTPMDLSAFLDALQIKITDAQSKRYMSLWRQFFTDRSWMSSMASRGLELYLVGNDLATLRNWIRNPALLNNSRRKLFLDLRLTARTSLHAGGHFSIDNCDRVIRETYELLDEFIVKSDYLTDSLEYGIVADYSGFLIGKGLIKNDAVTEPWLELTITSATKCTYRTAQTQTTDAECPPNTLVGLWYGKRSMQRWCVSSGPTEMKHCVETGVILRIDNDGSLQTPLNESLHGQWDVTRVLDRRASTGAHLYQDQQSFDCTDMFKARDKQLDVI